MCEVGKNFTSVSYYNKEMQKGMEDKLFFINKLPANQKYVFVDFGCADGSMINALSAIYEGKDHVYVGYDISETMISIAKTNYHGPTDENVRFTADWEEVLNILVGTIGYKKVLILSSVIHEVYSYAESEQDIKTFWDRVCNHGFDYIVIRDMCPSDSIFRNTHWSNVDKILNNCDETQLGEFEKVWGSITKQNNFVHFLLKYRWKINWKREVNENYFPITVQTLLTYFKDFNIDYFERFRVPFLDECWMKDFSISIEDYTHIKAIFSKK